MDLLLEYGPFLVAMLALVGASAFFSCSEAALFYLGRRDRDLLRKSSRGGRTADRLLQRPQRLLTAILFWNLLINIAYFTLVSIVSVRLEGRNAAGTATMFSSVAVVTLILFSEMLPKNLAVLQTRLAATLVGIPLAVAVRLVDPVIPMLQAANLVSRRLVFGNTEPEPYLELHDLERAVSLSSSNRTLLQHEHHVLQNIVALSEVRIEELMRPRTQFLSFQPPVHVADLEGRTTPSGYLLVSEPDTEEVSAVLPLRDLFSLPANDLHRFAEPLIYIPWCVPAGEALDQMRRGDREVAAVINEYGETIGIVTFDDVLQAVFLDRRDPQTRKSHRISIVHVGPGRWKASGMIGLHRLQKTLGGELPETRSVTLAGLLQERLQRLPETGDLVECGDYRLRVLEVPRQGPMVVEVSLNEEAES